MTQKNTDASARVDALWLPLDALREWEANPRNNDGRPVEDVAASIREFGFVAPIVVWKSAGRMVAGHTRLKAMRALMAEDSAFTPKGAPGPGLAKVIFHEFDSDKQADAYAIADNRLGELASWDEPKLGAMLAKIRTDDEVPLAAVGYRDDEVDAKLKAILADSGAPVSFTSYDETLPTEYKCPKCSYAWSGKPS